MQRPRTIKGLSDAPPRLPRIGKIHLGVKAKTQGGKEYPTKTDYFVCPPEVQAIYGEKPRDLDVILPADTIEENFPLAWKYYRTGVGLWCSGDGETATRVGNGGEMEEVECPCEFAEDDEKGRARCKKMGNLMVIIPKVSLGGVYQIDTGSINSILNIQGGMAFIQDRYDRLRNVPCRLSLRPKEAQVEGKKTVIYAMTLTLANFEQIRALTRDMNEIKALLGGNGDDNGRRALPEPSPETDLIPAEVVENIPHDPREEAPEGGEDFQEVGQRKPEPLRPAPQTTRKPSPAAPPADDDTF